MGKFIDRTGKEFGTLLVRKRVPSPIRKGPAYWECECLACGRVLVVHGSNLVSQRSCGCQKFKHGHDHMNWHGVGDINGTFYNKLRQRAKTKKKEWSVTIHYLWELFEKQGGKCSLSGVDLSLPKSTYGKRTASLDRIDSRIGYVEGNVQWVHREVNFMKQHYPQGDFLEWCRKIAEKNPRA